MERSKQIKIKTANPAATIMVSPSPAKERSNLGAAAIAG